MMAFIVINFNKCVIPPKIIIDTLLIKIVYIW